MSRGKTIILAGSGHAHLEVLKALSREEIEANQFVLVSPFRDTYYSGLIPSLIMGDIEAAQLTISSADFAERKGFQFIQDAVVSFSENEVVLASGAKLNFDLLSLNVGGWPQTLPTAAPNETIYLRPFDSFLPRWHEIQKIIKSKENPRFVVVGGGAAAVEVATALRVHLGGKCYRGEVHLVAKGPKLCENYSKGTSVAILRSLSNLGVRVHLNEAVETIGNRYIDLKNGEKLNFETIFVVIPTNPASLTSKKIDSTLRIAPRVFAVGDGTAMQHQPSLPRSGVMAVRQGQHLAVSLRRMLSGQHPTEFTIPRRQLNILISGEKTARAVWGGVSFEGRLPFRIKRWIDEKYIDGFALENEVRFV